MNPDTQETAPAVDPTPPLKATSEKRISRQELKLLMARDQITQEFPDRADFLHSCMCQVGLPRKRTESRSFERHSGHISMLLEAGKLFNGSEFVEQPLPYGTTPRLVMVHVSSEAIRTQRRDIEIGSTMRQFLNMLGMQTSGGPRGGYVALKRQMEALAACRLTLGMYSEGRAVTVDTSPIKRFEAWLQHDEAQTTMWPGVLELSQDFFDTLAEHAVPLDYRALGALKHSALALDIYTWLAHRLCRVSNANGVMLSWENLRDQFGQEYGTSKDFKKEFRGALQQVVVVYPDARVREVNGGLVLYESRPPLSKTMISTVMPHSRLVDKSGG